MKARISLMHYNDRGAVAAIDDGDMDRVQIVLSQTKRDAPSICAEAAKRLRKLADAFERLAEADDPFTDKAQKQAMKLVR